VSETAKRKKRRKVYCLRVRPDDQSEWSEASEYSTQKARDSDAYHARILAGYRTHSFERVEVTEHL
jgi:hypothetical protein